MLYLKQYLLSALLAFVCGEVDINLNVQINGGPPGIVPEGIEFYDGSFLLSSLGSGSVFAVPVQEQSQDVEATVFSDSGLIASLGLQIYDGELAVCNWNGIFGASNQSDGFFTIGLNIYHQQTGELRRQHDLSTFSLRQEDGGGLANDVINFDGDWYVTEFISGTVFRVDGTTGAASVFCDDDLLKGPLPASDGGFGANGIEVFEDPDGNSWFIVSVQGFPEGRIVRIKATDPTIVNEVEFVDSSGASVDANYATNIDGIIFDGIQNNLFTTDQGAAAVRQLRSNDDWLTAYLVEEIEAEQDLIFSGLTTTTMDSDGYVWSLQNGNFDADGEVRIQRFNFAEGPFTPPIRSGGGSETDTVTSEDSDEFVLTGFIVDGEITIASIVLIVCACFGFFGCSYGCYQRRMKMKADTGHINLSDLFA